MVGAVWCNNIDATSAATRRSRRFVDVAKDTDALQVRRNERDVDDIQAAGIPVFDGAVVRERRRQRSRSTADGDGQQVALMKKLFSIEAKLDKIMAKLGI